MKVRNFRTLRMFLYIVPLLALLAAGPVSEGAAPEKAVEKPKAERQLPGFGKYRVVRVDREGIAPRSVTVEAGTTVIWFNATGRFSSMVFNEGNRLRNSTKAPTLFFLATDGTFISSAIGPGATASLAFIRPGTYSYFITGLEVSGGGAFARVIVK